MSLGDFMAPPDLRLVGTCERLESTQVRSLRFLSSQTYPNGSLCYVRSVKCYFRLDRSSTSTDDAITVVTAQGGGRWHRMSSDFLTESPWLEQDEWYIDADNGDDELGGDSIGTAIASHAEFERRMGRNPLITKTITVNIRTDLNEVLCLEASFLGEGACLHYVGRRTRVILATCGSWTPFNTNQEGWITSPTIADFSPYLGLQLEILSGPRIGYTTFISALATGHVGGNRARVGAITAITGTPLDKDAIDIRANDDSGEENLFELNSIPVVGGLQLRAHRLDAPTQPTWREWDDQLTFLVDSLDIYVAPTDTAVEVGAVLDCDARCPEPNIMLYRCRLSAYDDLKVMGRGIAVWGCTSSQLPERTTNGVTFYDTTIDVQGHCGGIATFWNCVLSAGTSVWSNNYFDARTGAVVVQFQAGTRIGMAAPFGGQGIDFGVYVDSNTYAIFVDSCSGIVVDDVWGAQTGAGPGWRVDGRCIYDTLAEIQTFVVGAGSETVIGGANIAYGALPNINANNHAMMVAEW